MKVEWCKLTKEGALFGLSTSFNISEYNNIAIVQTFKFKPT